MVRFDPHDPEVAALMLARSREQASRPGLRARLPIFVLPTEDEGAAWSAHPGDWVDHEERVPAIADLAVAMSHATDYFVKLQREWKRAEEDIAAVFSPRPMRTFRLAAESE
jgi:hypothetical protein